jgi:NAD(P)-dependent dehydrogenase (short-subunit alcohol dehydrogenase family)
LRSLIDKTVARFGRLDAAVNCAGTEGTPGPVTEQTAETYAATFDTNVLGTLLSMKHELRVMLAQGSGSIVNVSSTYGIVSPDQAVYGYRRQDGSEFFKPIGYSVAKSGMLNFTRWLAEYCAPFGVRVNTLVPGGVKEAAHAPAFVAEYVKRTPLGRMANDDDYNGAIVFLASRASAYMTGAMLVIDGGWTAR